MRFFKKNKKEQKSEKESQSQVRVGNIKDILDGTVLTKEIVVRQIPFVLFLTVVAIVYIANRYQSEKIVRETARVQTEVKELRSEAIAVASELMRISKQSEVIKMIEENGLELNELTEPPKKIIVENE